MKSEILNKITGEKLRNLRIEKGLTQNDLAKIIGVSRTTIVNIEVGFQGLTFIHTLIASRFFSVSPEYFYPTEQEYPILINDIKTSSETKIEAKILKIENNLSKLKRDKEIYRSILNRTVS